MSKTVIAFAFKFILLVLAQAVIFNNIVLFDIAVAFVYIYLVITMPLTWTTNISVTLGFLAGLSIDVFADTQGVNALACTILAFVRKPVFHLYMQNDEDLAGLHPGIRTIGASAFMKYLVTMSLIYCACYFLIEAFALFNPLALLLRTLASTAFTFIVIYAIDSIFTHQK